MLPPSRVLLRVMSFILDFTLKRTREGGSFYPKRRRDTLKRTREGGSEGNP